MDGNRGFRVPMHFFVRIYCRDIIQFSSFLSIFRRSSTRLELSKTNGDYAD
jgi:hypothetical protein